MKLSNPMKYALDLLPRLIDSKGPVRAKAITSKGRKILTLLAQAGIVRSQRGRKGGYVLAKPADKITLAEIIQAVEGPLFPLKESAPQHVNAVSFGLGEAMMRFGNTVSLRDIAARAI